MPNPSDPNKRILFPSHFISVKSFSPFASKPYTQKFFSFKFFNVELLILKLETLESKNHKKRETIER